jgi:putative transposase
MGRKPRNFEVGRYYHVIARGNRGKDIFWSISDRRYLQKHLKKYCKETGIKLLVLCLMDNHLHMILRQGSGDSISKLMQRFLCSYSMYFNKKYGTKGHTFQGRFESKLLPTLKDIMTCLRYIRNNPVKAAITKRPDGYRWTWVNDFLLVRLVRPDPRPDATPTP